MSSTSCPLPPDTGRGNDEVGEIFSSDRTVSLDSTYLMGQHLEDELQYQVRQIGPRALLRAIPITPGQCSTAASVPLFLSGQPLSTFPLALGLLACGVGGLDRLVVPASHVGQHQPLPGRRQVGGWSHRRPQRRRWCKRGSRSAGHAGHGEGAGRRGHPYIAQGRLPPAGRHSGPAYKTCGEKQNLGTMLHLINVFKCTCACVCKHRRYYATIGFTCVCLFFSLRTRSLTK